MSHCNNVSISAAASIVSFFIFYCFLLRTLNLEFVNKIVLLLQQFVAVLLTAVCCLNGVDSQSYGSGSYSGGYQQQQPSPYSGGYNNYNQGYGSSSPSSYGGGYSTYGSSTGYNKGPTYGVSSAASSYGLNSVGPSYSTYGSSSSPYQQQQQYSSYPINTNYNSAASEYYGGGGAYQQPQQYGQSYGGSYY